MLEIKKPYSVFLIIGIVFLFNTTIYSHPYSNETLRVPSSFKDPNNKERIYSTLDKIEPTDSLHQLELAIGTQKATADGFGFLPEDVSPRLIRNAWYAAIGAEIRRQRASSGPKGMSQTKLGKHVGLTPDQISKMEDGIGLKEDFVGRIEWYFGVNIFERVRERVRRGEIVLDSLKKLELVIGEGIARRRIKEGLNYRQFSEKVGIPANVLMYMERGRNITEENLEIIASYFKIPCEDLSFGLRLGEWKAAFGQRLYEIHKEEGYTYEMFRDLLELEEEEIDNIERGFSISGHILKKLEVHFTVNLYREIRARLSDGEVVLNSWRRLLLHVGREIRRARKRKGMTQREVAGKFKKDRVFISFVESGRYLTPEYLEALGEVLGEEAENWSFGISLEVLYKFFGIEIESIRSERRKSRKDFGEIVGLTLERVKEMERGRVVPYETDRLWERDLGKVESKTNESIYERMGLRDQEMRKELLLEGVDLTVISDPYLLTMIEKLYSRNKGERKESITTLEKARGLTRDIRTLLNILTTKAALIEAQGDLHETRRIIGLRSYQGINWRERFYNLAKLRNALVERNEREIIRKALRENVWDPISAARALGISKRVIYGRIKKHDLWPEQREGQKRYFLKVLEQVGWWNFIEAGRSLYITSSAVHKRIARWALRDIIEEKRKEAIGKALRENDYEPKLAAKQLHISVGKFFSECQKYGFDRDEINEERRQLLEALKQVNWYDLDKAGEILGIKRGVLEKRIRDLGLRDFVKKKFQEKEIETFRNALIAANWNTKKAADIVGLSRDYFSRKCREYGLNQEHARVIVETLQKVEGNRERARELLDTTRHGLSNTITGLGLWDIVGEMERRNWEDGEEQSLVDEMMERWGRERASDQPAHFRGKVDKKVKGLKETSTSI